MGDYIPDEAMGAIACPCPQYNLVSVNKDSLGSAVIAANDLVQNKSFFSSVIIDSMAAKVLYYCQMDHKKRNSAPFEKKFGSCSWVIFLIHISSGHCELIAYYAVYGVNYWFTISGVGSVADNSLLQLF